MAIATKPSGSIALHSGQLPRPLLTVVVPVYNGGEEITANVEVIKRAIARGLGHDEFETVVVSDGSIDGTAERLLLSHSTSVRIIHYDRNLGKGYAVKAGALAAHGHWVAIVDADLDLDPASIPTYLDAARTEQLDLAIGSKRHPASVVYYPRSRRFASWAYQRLVRLLFRLDVRDTQVGLKVMRREVVEQVMPLLLVKRFAFDLELLAVARELGYGRIRELPVRLNYRFTQSGVRLSSVARALWDTAAVFYRLRLLRTYQRKRNLLGNGLPPPSELPLVTLLGEPAAADVLDYPRLELAPADGTGSAVNKAEGDIVAVLAWNARPAGNWLSSAVPYLVRGGATAVVVPTVAPISGSLSQRAAAAILESRLGGGSRRFRYFPGNVRVVSDYPAATCVVRREDLAEARAAGVNDEQLVAWLAERGRRTVYTPDTSISAPPLPLFRPHLFATLNHARSRGAAARRSKGRSFSLATALALAPTACAVLGVTLVTLDVRHATGAGLGLIIGYVTIVATSAAFAGLRFRSAWVCALAAPGLILTQATYAAGFIQGLVRAR